MASLRTAEDVFIDFCGRRRGILRALTTEVEGFFNQCNPDRENLCLYGYSDGSWEVALPCEEVPPELPEPTLGINFARDGMKRTEWLCLVAVHSDSWLMSIAFYNAARLDAEGRRQLFNNINTLPTVYEVVSGRATNANTPNANAAQVAKRASSSQPAMPAAAAAAAAAAYGPPGGYGAVEHAPHPPKRGRPSATQGRGGGARYHRAEAYNEDDDESDEEEEGASEPCPNCGRMYRRGEFWICCDHCDRWFDGKCVQMTEQKADRAKDWKCPFCAKRAGGEAF